MRIAVASQEKDVTEHFGHCETFWLFDFEGTKLVKSESIANPGHRPGFLPVFLSEKGVNVIISGGMGSGAIDIFNENNIKVVTGASGAAQDAAQAYVDGKLQSANSTCNHDYDEIHKN